MIQFLIKTWDDSDDRVIWFWGMFAFLMLTFGFVIGMIALISFEARGG